MLYKFIEFFIKRHLLTNMIFIIVFIAGFSAWHKLKKEEQPDVTYDSISISLNYQGASANEVEHYVTRPMEEALRGIDGVFEIKSTSSIGSSNVTVTIEPYLQNKDEVISEIRNAVMDVKLPEDIIDDPFIRISKTSRKAIIDIALLHEDANTLDVQKREELQAFALNLEQQLMNLREVSAVNTSGYLKNEFHIKIHPEKLIEYNIPFNTVIKEILSNNVRQPAGSIENAKEPKVTLYAELDTLDSLKELGIQGGFEGHVIKLKNIAEVVRGYEKTKSIIKINGHEGIFLNIVKSSQFDILEALDAVTKVTNEFQKNKLKKTKVKLLLLDDESFDVKNRLSLIKVNGALGFILILITLLIFLDFRSGFWVAMGIPFSFCCTIIISLFCGYTVNNITLAAVIIVMGMVVDDAIVVSENIQRLKAEGGINIETAGIKGTLYVFMPIIASILTTCVAFIPLYFFSSRFGMMVRFIPPIIFMMLFSSLFESLIILPSHMIFTFNKTKNSQFLIREKKISWFDKIEDAYGWIIEKILSFKWLLFLIFIVAFIYSFSIAKNKMKFVMFPDEETREIILTGEATPGTTRYETSKLTQPLEDIISKYIGKEVIGFRNEIARSRRGSAVKENTFRMRIEIVPKEKRQKSADQLIQAWKEDFIKNRVAQNFLFEEKRGHKKSESINKINNLNDTPYLTTLKFSKSWQGQSSGSPIEIIIKENDDDVRKKVADELELTMKKLSYLENAEIEKSITHTEYHIKLDRDKIRKLAINPSDIAQTLRAALEGKILYEFSGKDETFYVRLTIFEKAKDDINKILNLPIENESKYLVPLKDITNYTTTETPDSIIREDQKRVIKLYADIKKNTKKTPLDVAEYFEAKIFPQFQSEYPSTIIQFAGEIKDTRESTKDFMTATVLVIFLVYVILVLILNSLLKPFIIMLSIPFGIVGIIIAFYTHGIMFYGFFAIIGALGLAGVIVNDAIIMLVKLDKEFKPTNSEEENRRQIASIAKTRLRAIVLTTVTTVVGIMPTAYGFAGYDAMLAQMMLALAWGLLFGTVITLILIPSLYSILKHKV